MQLQGFWLGIEPATSESIEQRLYRLSATEAVEVSCAPYFNFHLIKR